MKVLKGHMIESLMEDTCQTWMTQSEVLDEWIQLTGYVPAMGYILVLDQRENMVIIVPVLTGVMRSNTCRMSSRNLNLLPFMES